MRTIGLFSRRGPPQLILRLKLHPHRSTHCRWRRMQRIGEPGGAQFEIVATGRGCPLVICCPLLGVDIAQTCESVRL